MPARPLSSRGRDEVSPSRCRREPPAGRRGRVPGGGEVAGNGEDGGGHQVPVPHAVPYGQFAEGGGEEPGGKGVAGADGGDDVDPEGGDRGDTLSPSGVGGTGPGAGSRKDRRPLGPPLHDQHPRLRQRRTDRLRAAQPPRLLRLVLTDEDEVGAAGQVEEDGRCGVAGAPQPRPVVHVEGDQRASGAGRGQGVEQGQAVLGQRRRDPGQVQDAAAERVLGGDVRRGHRRCRGPGPVVRDLVRVGRPVGRGTEVDACGPCRVALDRRCVDAVPGDRLDQMVAEPVRTDAADPLRPVARRCERAGNIGLGAPDRTAEGRHVGEAAGLGGQERHHGLAEADDIARRGGVGRPAAGPGTLGSSMISVQRRFSPLTRRRLGC